MLWRISFLVLLVSAFIGCGYWYYYNGLPFVKPFEYFSKDYEFTPKQIQFLKSIGVTSEDLSSISMMLAFAPLVASKTADAANEEMEGLMKDPKIAELFAQVYHCYRVPLDVSFKIIGSAFPSHVSSLANKLNAVILESQTIGETKCNPTNLYSGLQELIREGKFEGLKEFWKKHGSVIGLAKDAFPKSVTDIFERIASFTSISAPEPESGSKADKDE